MMWSTIAQVFLGLLGLSILVFIHELGHFLMAKRFGVRVKVFSIGFGKRLIKWRRGDTLYCISMIPFGGYVAMAGENPDTEERDPHPGDFLLQPVRARAAIAFAGPAINIVFAMLTLFALYMVGVQEPLTDRLIVGYVEEESPAAQAGLMPGDTILQVNGKETKGWDKFRENIGTSIGATIHLSLIDAQGKTKEITVVPQEFRDLGIGWIGVHPRHRVVVALEPDKGTAAREAGIHKGDTIFSVDHHHVGSHQDVVDAVGASQGKPLDFQILRNQDTLEISLAPRFNAEEKRFMIGIQMGLFALNESQLVRRGPKDAAIKALETSWHLSTSIFRYLGRMIQGQVKPKALSGPVGIVPIIGLSWLDSIQSLLMMLALISINLGVMNLLPLAITDGGILMFLALEALRGKPLSRRLQAQIQQGATLLFIALFIYLTFQDLSRFSLFLR